MSRTGYFSNTFTIINNAILKNKNLRKIKSLYYYIDSLLLNFIKKPKKEECKKKKIIIAFNLSLGDGAIFMTGLKNLRKIYPEEQYEITLACQKGLNKMYEKLNIFDKVIALNFTGSTVNLKNRIRTFKELRKEYYDIALDPIGIEECTTNILMNRAICSDEKVGIINKDRKIYCSQKIYNKVYTKIIEISGEKISCIEHYNKFLNGLSDKKFPIEFIDLPSEKVKESLPEEYFIIYPSASTEYKRWPVERYVEIAKKMYNILNIPLILCGTGVDREINDKFKNLLGDRIPVIDMLDKTTILEYIDLIKNAKYVITNDTGIYHIATISQVPTAVLSGGYTFDRYMAYNFEGKEKFKRPYIIVEEMKCFNCENRCIYKNEIDKTWPCLEKITIEKAWKTIEKMIKENN